jgi:nicotinamide mononucleotide transporter
MSYQKQLFLQSLGVGMVLTMPSFLVSVQMGWFQPSDLNWLEVFAVFTSYSCTYLCVRQSRWNYPIGILTTFIYSWFYYSANEPAYALAVFNLYLVGSLMFGYYRWGPDGNTKPVSFVQGPWWAAYVASGVAIYLALQVAIAYGAVVSQTEVAIVVLSGVAQFLLDNKKLETWAVWIVVNVLSIYFYIEQGWYLVAFQYVFFLANAFWGAYEWNKSRKQTLGVA